MLALCGILSKLIDAIDYYHNLENLLEIKVLSHHNAKSADKIKMLQN